MVMSYFPDVNQEHHVHIGTATTYHFRWAKEFSAWAIFTINDATGEFNIQSDWGAWSYRWNINSLGDDKTLTAFLAECSGPDYVVNKLGYNQPRDFSQQISSEKTINYWKEKILNARMADSYLHELVAKIIGFEFEYVDGISRDTAKEIWQELKDFSMHYDLGHSEASAVHAINEMSYSYKMLYKFLGNNDLDIWESMITEPSWSYIFLRKHLLPFFFNYLRKDVLKIPERP